MPFLVLPKSALISFGFFLRRLSLVPVLILTGLAYAAVVPLLSAPYFDCPVEATLR